jgi:hypothetical protein
VNVQFGTLQASGRGLGTGNARKVAILLAIGDREFTFGELSMNAGCHLANKNYDY